MDNNELLKEVKDLLNDHMEVIQTLFDAKITEVKVMIENDVTARIDSLFDGYKLTHEKQWELERANERQQKQIAEILLRLAALENKSA